MWKDLFISIGIVAGICVILGVALALSHKYLAVKEDERITKVTEMLPNANCGGCGYPGCSGLATALVDGRCKKVGTCKVLKPEPKQAIKDYLESTPGPDGNTIKVDL